MSVFEIVAGDFGGQYKVIVEGVNLEDGYTATMYVWRGTEFLIEGKDCSSITYDKDKEESWCVYTVAKDDFPTTAAINGKRTVYKAQVKFIKTSFQEHDLGFEWLVIPAPPVS